MVRNSRQSGITRVDQPLYTGSDWDFDKINRVNEAIALIADKELELDIYPNQIEVITSEQMLDAYSSIGMPLMYNHWSFGKHFARDEMMYRKGQRGLAYEIVINSSPCISYIMEENSMTMQTLVIAHAAFGHNHFFKNNHLFRQWTDARGILDYLEFAKRYISQCEERYGARDVERVLDAAHALMNYGVHRYPKKRPPDLAEEVRRERERRDYHERIFNDIWRTVPGSGAEKQGPTAASERKKRLGMPEENILYFLEKNSPNLRQWQREVIRIVRTIAQYFYPQRQTKVMNEGCATSVHYHIMNRLHETGRINDGSMMEFLHSHTSVVFQPEFDDPRYSGFNPYTLGFEMFQDMKRIAEQPTDEDRVWFPEFAGTGDPFGVWRDAWANYRDESFILQFLSPHLVRKLRLFRIVDDEDEPTLLVNSIHDESGYRDIIRSLAAKYDVGVLEPDIQVIDVDLAGDRKLILQHRVHNGILLEKSDSLAVLQHIADLWGYEVHLVEVDAETDMELNSFRPVGPRPAFS